MKPFQQHTGIVVPLRIDNIDTDQIIPSREMNRVSKSGLGDGLFASWRYHYDGAERNGPDKSFVLNLEEYDSASILLAGKNFGCGSSREHAVWALGDFGFRVVIAESFGRIFHRNCARNGLLAIELNAADIARIEESIKAAPQKNLVLVDLEQSHLRLPQGETLDFEVSSSDREMLLHGLDPIEYTLQFENDIDAFIARDRKDRLWAYLS